MKSITYKKHLIIFTHYQWGTEVSAIPDHGETIRQKFIGYTKRDMVARIKLLIKGGSYD
jgi:hypothetical protein